MVGQLPNVLFVVVMALAAVGWLALIVFPRKTWANLWVSGLTIPLLLSFVYMYLVVAYWFQPPAAQITQFLSLEGVYAMFANRGLLLAGWTDLVTMDLVAGAWMARKAAQIRMPFIYLLPCLLLTFVFAGFGFTLFALLAALGSGWQEIASFETQPPVNTAPLAVRPVAVG